MGKRDVLRRRIVLGLGAAIYAVLYAFCSQIDEAGYIQWRAAAVRFGLAPFVRPRRFASIREWLAGHIFSTGADDIPVVRWLFNTGFVFWLLLLLVLYDMYCGRWSSVLLCMLPVLLWGTYLLGPVMQGRYLYPFICVLPLFLFRRRAADVKSS